MIAAFETTAAWLRLALEASGIAPILAARV